MGDRRQDPGRLAPRLGGSRAAASPYAPQLSAERVVAQALGVLRDDAASADHDAAADALAGLGVNAIPALLHLMHDDSPRVRRAAARGLGLILDRRQLGKLVRSAHWTAAALAEPDRAAAVSRLLGAFAIGTDPTRVAAAVALGRAGDPRAVPDLIEALADQHMLTRLAVIHALGLLGGDEPVPHLADVLHDPSEVIRAAAHAALARIDTPQARSALQGMETSDD